MEKRKHIMLVEDEEQVRYVMSLVLEGAGYEVTMVESGDKALELFAAGLAYGNPIYDLLITDVRMPEMTGVELLEHLKSLGVSIPCLAISGYANKGTVVELMRFGCNNFIDKPLSIDQLIDAVKFTFDAAATSAM